AVVEPLAGLRLMDPFTAAGEISPGFRHRALFEGFRTFELARTDVSTAVAYSGQAMLFRNAVLEGGSPEQVAELDAAMSCAALPAVYAPTERANGSDGGRGMRTRARREGEEWVVHGAKRCVGGAAHADVLAVLARDEEDDQVKAFLVDR